MAIVVSKLGITKNIVVKDIKQSLDGGAVFSSIGNGSISGIVKEDGLPVIRRIMLYDRYSGILIKTVYSKPNGEYSFKDINENLLYYIVSLDEYDDGINCPAVIQDRILGSYDKDALS